MDGINSYYGYYARTTCVYIHVCIHTSIIVHTYSFYIRIRMHVYRNTMYTNIYIYITDTITRAGDRCLTSHDDGRTAVVLDQRPRPNCCRSSTITIRRVPVRFDCTKYSPPCPVQESLSVRRE